jgi:hypothetical protein
MTAPRTPDAAREAAREAAFAGAQAMHGDDFAAYVTAFLAGWDAALRRKPPTSRSSYESDCCRAAYDIADDLEGATCDREPLCWERDHICQLLREAAAALRHKPSVNDAAVGALLKALRKYAASYWHMDCGLKGGSRAWASGKKDCANCYLHELAAAIEAALAVMFAETK